MKILPLKFSNIELLNDLVVKLCLVFDSVNVINTDIDIEDTYDIERRQYYSTKIIEIVLKSNITVDDNLVILTDSDLYIPALTYVFGEAQLNGKYSIVSTCRLHEEFYTSEINYELLLERTYKEILHELGHNFGLLHCVDWDCVMHSSTEIEQVDIKGNHYCKECRDLIWT